MGRLVIIDGNAILHRAYHALPPLTTAKGELVNAVFGFCSMLLRVIHDLKPQYLVVTFDRPKPTFRKLMYVGYQAKRPKMADELSSQIEPVHRVLETMEIPIYEIDGYEADDVIGTLVSQAASVARQQFSAESEVIRLRRDHDSSKIGRAPRDQEIDEVIIVTGDKDILQLVDERTKVYMPVKGLFEAKLFGEKEVEERLGVKPSQVVDYKALVGDSADNYPGVEGVGPKTASGLLGTFGTLENLYKNLGILGKEKAGLAKKLAEGAESAGLAKKLATIVTDVPVKLDLGKCKIGKLDKPEVVKLFAELEFNSLIRRFKEGNKEDMEDKDDKGEQIRLF